MNVYKQLSLPFVLFDSSFSSLSHFISKRENPSEKKKEPNSSKFQKENLPNDIYKSELSIMDRATEHQYIHLFQKLTRSSSGYFSKIFETP